MKAVRFCAHTRSINPLSNRLHYIPNLQITAHRSRLFHQRIPSEYPLANRSSTSKTQPVASTIRRMSVVATPMEQFVPFLRPEDKVLHNNVATHSQEPTIHSAFEEKTGTWQYIVADPSTKKAVIIDAVLDYDANSRTISTSTADKLLATIISSGYRIEKILETHAHADHLTAASYLQHRLSQMQGFRSPICIGKRIAQVQRFFAAKYDIPAEEYEGVFDQLFEDGESFSLGQLTVSVMHLPGHTPDHLGYQISKNVFCGDSIFHADIGTARCDFPGGSAKDLYTSAKRLLSLPEDVKIWTGHDYPACPARCEAVPWMTVQDHRQRNKHVSMSVAEEDFLALRQERDAGLAAPKLLDPSLQINIRAGRLPRPTLGGERLMLLPVKMQCDAW